MRKMRFLLVLTVLTVFLSNGFAREPIELPANIASAKLQGSGRLTWFGLHIYDASFYQVGSLSSPDFVLNLRYQRSFSGASIANRSVEEMKRIGVPEAQASLWGERVNHFLAKCRVRINLNSNLFTQAGDDFLSRRQADCSSTGC